jgi:hypothetical protein
MGQLHALGASAVLVAVVAVGLATGVFALRGGSPWVDRLRLGLTLIIGAQVLFGVVVFLTGARPGELLHVLYGVVALALLPLATTFATEAPARDRAWVLVAACILLLPLLWRLAATG